MAKQTGLMGRKVRFSVIVATHIGDTVIKEYSSREGVCVSGSWGRGYWSKQFVNVLADDGHIYELELRSVTVLKDEPTKVEKPLRAAMTQKDEGWDKL